MIEQLLSFIQEESKEAITHNPEIPNEYNEQLIQEAQSTILAGLQGADESQLKEISHLVQRNQLGADNNQVQAMAQQFSNNAANKFGLNSGMLKTIAAILIPIILKKLFSGNGQQAPTASNNSNFDLGGILGSIVGSGALNSILGGGNSGAAANSNNGGIMDQLSNIGKAIGLDKDNDGDVDLKDLLGGK